MDIIRIMLALQSSLAQQGYRLHEPMEWLKYICSCRRIQFEGEGFNKCYHLLIILFLIWVMMSCRWCVVYRIVKGTNSHWWIGRSFLPIVSFLCFSPLPLLKSRYKNMSLAQRPNSYSYPIPDPILPTSHPTCLLFSALSYRVAGFMVFYTERLLQTYFLIAAP